MKKLRKQRKKQKGLALADMACNKNSQFRKGIFVVVVVRED